MIRIIYNTRNRFKGTSIETIKKELYKNYPGEISMHALELDHIIPFLVSEDSSIKNLQLLKRLEHIKKTSVDKKIIKELKKLGYLKKVMTYYETEYSKKALVSKYNELMTGMTQMTGNSHINP